MTAAWYASWVGGIAGVFQLAVSVARSGWVEKGCVCSDSSSDTTSNVGSFVWYVGCLDVLCSLRVLATLRSSCGFGWSSVSGSMSVGWSWSIGVGPGGVTIVTCRGGLGVVVCGGVVCGGVVVVGGIVVS